MTLENAFEYAQQILGFGIELYLAAEIVRMHEGEIWGEREKGGRLNIFLQYPSACGRELIGFFVGYYENIGIFSKLE